MWWPFQCYFAIENIGGSYHLKGIFNWQSSVQVEIRWCVTSWFDKGIHIVFANNAMEALDKICHISLVSYTFEWFLFILCNWYFSLALACIVLCNETLVISTGSLEDLV